MVLAAAFSTPVFADPAGPTDYRSEVVSVDPATADIEVEIIGGDSFVQLTAQPGTDVIVVGYRGEPYLWFRPDGTVAENRNAPTTYQNLSRYGSEAPAGVDAGGRAGLAAGGVGPSMGVARPSGALDAGHASARCVTRRSDSRGRRSARGERRGRVGHRCQHVAARTVAAAVRGSARSPVG